MSRPRVLFVGRSRLRLPLEPWLEAKWDALGEELDYRVLNAGEGADPGRPRFRLLSGSAQVFYPRLPAAVVHELRAFRPDAVVAGDPLVAAAVLAARAASRSRAKVIAELHGDPGTFARLYGADSRKLVAPVTDAVGRFAIRRADGTRAVSSFTSSIVERIRGEPPTACFTAYHDLSAFEGRPPVPLPAESGVVFVAALEAYKNVDGLAAAWRQVAGDRADGRLVVVGRGSRREVVDRLVADLPGRVEHHPRLTPVEVAEQLDRAWALVLPSYPEGLGLVVIEAFTRGRAVVATDGGGIPEIVTDGRDGLLIPPGDTGALASALERVLDDRALAERLGAEAYRSSAAWRQTPAEFAVAYRELVDRVLAGAR